MAQVASYQVPAHPSGLDMRTQLNAIVLAILGDNSGPTAPTTTYPGMMWGDTTAMRLKRRNNANTAWVDIGPIDDFLGTIRTQASTAVQRTGDTMTGALQMYSASGAISMQTYYNAAGYAPHIRSNNAVPGIEIVNGANTAAVWNVTDGGIMYPVGYRLASTGSIYFTHTKGAMSIRGDQGIGANGGLGMINNAGNAWRFQISDEGYWNFPNYCIAPINVAPTSLDTNGFQGTLGPGYLKLNEYNYGGYLDFARARSEDYQWRIHYSFSTGSLEFISKTGQYVSFGNNGDIYSTLGGYWLIGTINEIGRAHV